MKTLVSGVVLLLIISVPCSASDKPNIILVMADDQGWGDMAYNGHPTLKTPHFDAAAATGLRFDRFYAAAPVCSPTRASVMTGRDYYRTGVIHTSRGGAKMHGDEVTIAEVLGSAGYKTAILGKWHLGDNYPMRPQDQGFRRCWCTSRAESVKRRTSPTAISIPSSGETAAV